MNRLLILLFSILFLSISCSNRTKKNLSDDNFENLLFQYNFENAFMLIKENSVKKDSIEWDVLKQRVYDSISIFKNSDDYYKGIELTVKLINDGHSIFFRPNEIEKAFAPDMNIPKINHKIIEKEIGYLKIPGFFANDSIGNIFALQIRKTLKKIDETDNLSGWIIDLRGNTGGNSTTMILGIAPLLTDSIIGYSINNKNELKVNKYKDNYFYLGNKKLDSINSKISLKNRGKKIAILVDSITSSAGELLTIALRNSSNASVFGTKTGGFTSHVIGFSFASGAKLLLATEYFCDKNKNIIRRIEPDVNCNPENTLYLATNWIKNTTYNKVHHNYKH